MSAPLRSKLDELASSFANDVLHALRSASIEDLLAESMGGARPASRPAAIAPARGRRRASRLARRSAGDIGGVVDRIVGLLRASPKGLRAEQIRQKLGVQSKELPRPLKEAVDAGKLGKSGQKRATTYFLKGAPAAHQAGASKARAQAKKRPPRKAAKKK